MDKYRIVTKEVLADNLTLEDANYTLNVFKDQGKTDLEIEKHSPDTNRLGRDPDLH
tara:strand:+ start:2906 stop:3073 length:168 start_codon:yes stop_codon:yes gene_type:complete